MAHGEPAFPTGQKRVSCQLPNVFLGPIGPHYVQDTTVVRTCQETGFCVHLLACSYEHDSLPHATALSCACHAPHYYLKDGPARLGFGNPQRDINKVIREVLCRLSRHW
jgi:hypothetical protein